LSVVELKEKILSRVRYLVEQQGLGITIEDVELRSIPPRQVKEAFARVINADLERRKAIDDAHAYANRVLSTAQGEANSLIHAGQTERTRLVQGASAQARYFADQLPHYRQNTQFFMARLQADTLQRVLTNAQDKTFRGDGGQRQMRIQLSREPVRPAPPPTTP